MKSFYVTTLFLLLTYGLYALDENKQTDEPKWGKIEGLFRAYHVFGPSYIKTGRENDYSIDGSAIGGHIRYYTPVYLGIGATTALYYARGTGLNDKNDPDTIMAAGRFFTADYLPKAILGELSLHYTDKTNRFVIGRFKIDSPLTNAIFTYMPNMYQAALYENSVLEDTKITLAQIEKMAYGTRAPVEFGLIGELTRTAGTTQNAMETRGDFIDIEKQTLADSTVKTNGVSTLGIVNTSLPDTKIRAWNFYAHDIMNMFYLDVEYKPKEADLPYTLSAQYLRTDSVGKNLASAWMDANSAYLMGLKASMQYKKAFFYLAYNHSGNAKILNPWSGDPAYTSSFFSKNAYRANVDAYKVGFNYALTDKWKLITSYADYGKSTTLGTFAPAKPLEPVQSAQNDAFEGAFLLSYNPTKQLNILGAVIYKESEYFYAGKEVQILDLDLLITYKF